MRRLTRAVLDAAGKLGKIVLGMNRALGEIPVTVKLRTGVKDGKNTAHKLMPRLGPEFGVSAITVSNPAGMYCFTCAHQSYAVVVARADKAAKIHETCGLGLRQAMRRCRARTRAGRGPYVPVFFSSHVAP